MIRKPFRTLTFLLLALALCGVCGAAGTEYSQDVQVKNADPSPLDAVTGSSVNQFTRGETNSRVDDYIYQDEQIEVSPSDGIVKVLRTNQKVNVNDYVPKLIPVKHVSVRELRPAVRSIVGLEGGTAEVVIDPVTKENFVYVVAPRFMLPHVEQAVRDLDQAWLNATDDGTKTDIYRGRFRDVREIDPLVELAMTQDFTVAFDVMNNTVTYTEDPVHAEKYRQLAERVDVPANEITVEAKFYGVDRSNDQKLGLDWIAWKNGPGRNLFELIFAGQNNSEHYRGASSIFNPLTPPAPADPREHNHFETTGRQYYASVNFFATAAYLDFLQSKGKAKVLVAPVLQTHSGRLAEWASVDEVASISVSGTNDKDPYDAANSRRLAAGTTGSSGDLGAWDRFVNYTKHNGVRSGAELTILPFVGTESTEMYVHAAVSGVTGVTPRGLPIVAERAVTSDVRTKDGQTLVIAGLRRMEKIKQRGGIPGLSRLPVLGYIFGGETKLDRLADVVVTLDTHTSIGSESKMEMPKQMATVVTQVESPDLPKIAPDSFGFDQWLLDPEKQPASQ